MASGRPTLNTLIKALSSPQCDSIARASELLLPTNPSERVLGGWDQYKRDQIAQLLIALPAPEDADTLKRLGLAVVGSGVVSCFIDDWSTGLITVACEAMKQGRQDWMDTLTAWAPQTLWMASQTTQHVHAWLAREDTPSQLRWRFGQLLAKQVRSKGAIRGAMQARKTLEMLDMLLEKEGEDQFPLSARDLPAVDRLVAKVITQDHERVLRLLRRQALEQETRWSPTREPNKPHRM